MQQAPTSDQALFQISTVSSMTGVNAVTLRAWERRYGLIRPLRTDAGHRLYTEGDIARIKLILQLLDQGIPVSRVRAVLEQESRDLPGDAGPEDPWLSSLNGMLRAVAGFDEAALESIYNEAMSLYPVDVVTRRLLLPLLEQLGERWETHAGGIAEEHFFSVYLRNKLGGRFHHRNLQNAGPCMIAACLPGEEHEFGLLLFTLAIHARGYRLIMLGADMPLDELPEVARRTGSAGIILSGSSVPNVDQLAEGLRRLTRATDIPVMLGGACSVQHGALIESCGVTPLSDDTTVGIRLVARIVPPVTRSR